MKGKWDPIPIRQLDLTNAADSLLDGARLASRTWLELVVDDHIVGVVDLASGESVLTAQQVDDFKERFAAPQPAVTPSLAEDEFPEVSIVVPTICAQS